MHRDDGGCVGVAEVVGRDAAGRRATSRRGGGALRGRVTCPLKGIGALWSPWTATAAIRSGRRSGPTSTRGNPSCSGRPTGSRASSATCSTTRPCGRATGRGPSCVLAGSGDNGGDALFAGARLAADGRHVAVLRVGSRVHEAGLAAALDAGARLLDGPSGARDRTRAERPTSCGPPAGATATPGGRRDRGGARGRPGARRRSSASACTGRVRAPFPRPRGRGRDPRARPRPARTVRRRGRRAERHRRGHRRGRGRPRAARRRHRHVRRGEGRAADRARRHARRADRTRRRRDRCGPGRRWSR